MGNCAVGLCGAHGTGKSTILKWVKSLGRSVDETPSLSRTAQAALGWDNLSRAHESAANTWALQNAILKAMRERDTRINESGILTLVDRTPADLYGYLHVHISRLARPAVDWKRVGDYTESLKDLASTYRRHIFVPLRSEIPFVAESNRADAGSRKAHSFLVWNFLNGGKFPFSNIESLDVTMRANEAALWL